MHSVLRRRLKKHLELREAPDWLEPLLRAIDEDYVQADRDRLLLERSLELFEEGVKLARSAQERLDRAERKVEELLGVDASGRPVTRELASGGEG